MNSAENREISESSLPPWMELDTIYYFSCKSAEDRSPFLGKIPLKALNFDVQTQVSEEITQEYEFKLHTKERVFVFRAELVTDLNKWVASIGGFLGDVALDPLTYVGVKPTKGVGKTEALLKAVQSGADDVAEETSRILATNPTRV